MKILYITIVNFAAPSFSGFKRKIEEQVLAFKDMGHEVHLMYRSGNKIMYDKEIIHYRNKRYQYLLLQFWMKKFLKKTNAHYDIIYIRKFWFFPWLLPVFKFFSKIANYVLVEIPTYPYKGEYSKGALYKSFVQLDNIGIWLIKKYLTCWITFSEYNEIEGLHAIKIKNGLNMAGTPFLGFDKNYFFSQHHLRLLGVAAVSNYHAYDRIVEGMYIYHRQKGRVKITFDIVGEGTHIAYLKNKAAEYNLVDAVKFYGYQPKEKLPDFFNQADILIGTMGYHRNGIKGSSALKMAEYLAIGKPSIWSFDMPEFTGNNYMKIFETDDSPIDMNDLIEWYKNFSYLPQDIRAYAEANFSWQSQFEKIFVELNNQFANSKKHG